VAWRLALSSVSPAGFDVTAYGIGRTVAVAFCEHLSDGVAIAEGL
jgi:hypothetical protein